ncbi:hypothetical protein R1sor_017649 [Riccia sorocarpa]|uniref:Uncharacterized protein n=1 Tax=Riccia sorocarpa TaxID=122646 RepID=A0ABD3IBH3_9MARC
MIQETHWDWTQERYRNLNPKKKMVQLCPPSINHQLHPDSRYKLPSVVLKTVPTGLPMRTTLKQIEAEIRGKKVEVAKETAIENHSAMTDERAMEEHELDAREKTVQEDPDVHVVQMGIDPKEVDGLENYYMAPETQAELLRRGRENQIEEPILDPSIKTDRTELGPAVIKRST